MEKLLVWGGQVEKVPCTEHPFAWSGKMPCTGVYRCVLCGITKWEAEKMSRRKTPPIVIKTRKIIMGRRIMREVLFVSALKVEELPEEYLQGVPKVCLDGERIFIYRGQSDMYSDVVHAGSVFSETYFQDLLDVCRQAGVRLAEIAHSQPTKWEGEETFVI